MKVKVILISLLALFIFQQTMACFFVTSFCTEAANINGEKIVVGTISNSSPNSIDLDILNVLFGVENNPTITIWDASVFQCTGPWYNNANDMGAIGDTILCIIEPINNIINPWDVVGEYRRANSLGGYASFVNFSIGFLFEHTYTYNEVLSLDMANYCCNNLQNSFAVNTLNLPANTGSSTPIPLTGYPAGGTFSGPGIVFNAFNPQLAGPGNHVITYTYNDEFGCTFIGTDEILVFTINFNFVNYNIGVISPKLSNQIDIELDVIEQDQYSFEVFDMNGKLFHQNQMMFETGKHLQEIKFNQTLTKGVYYLKVTNSNTSNIKKFVVTH